MISNLRSFLNIGSGIVSILVYVTLIIEFTFLLTMTPFNLFNEVHHYIFLLILFDSLIRLLIRPAQSFGYRRVFIGCLALFPVLSYYGFQFSLIDINLNFEQVILFIIALSRIQHLSFLFAPFRANPTQLFIGGFVLFILLGTIFLMLPVAHVDSISFIDAFFVAASAVCVTGLTVFDIGTQLTPIGQLMILILIQIGGLGIMTFYALLTISLSQRFLSTESQELQDGWATESMKETFGLVRSIFVVTIVVELIGAYLIYSALPDQIQGINNKLFYAVFHSVSAFCNAGFSLFADSIAIFSNSPLMIMVFSVLIVLGGIGFPVIFELHHRYFVKDRQRLKLQTKMAIFVTSILIIIGALVIFFQSTSEGQPSFLMALFHSISARTAGFSMQDMSYYSLSSLWFILILMFIGASPGSTGGGIKTTTFGLLLVALVSTIRSKARIHVFDRHVKPQLVFKALTIFTMSFFIVFLSFFILLMTESIDFFPLLFETVSAFATVGYSLGVTHELSVIGKLIIIFLMFFGRVGPLTLAIALTRRPKEANYKLPDEHVLLG